MCNCFAQQESAVVFSVGASIPKLDFGSQSTRNASAGFASQGISFDITATSKSTEYFGVFVLIRGQQFSTQHQPILDDLLEQNPGFTGTIDRNPWRMIGGLVGLKGDIPLTDEIRVEPKLSGGILYFVSPDLNITLTRYNVTQNITYKSSESTTFAYLFGMGIKYMLQNNNELNFTIDYMRSQPEFTDVERTWMSSGITIDSYSQRVGMLTLSVGYGLHF
jgi:hypothetical protein